MSLRKLNMHGLVFNQKFIVDGRLYETEDKGEILISMADDLTFIRLD